MAPMHAKRCYVNVAACDGVIYAMGGYDGSIRQSSAEKYSPELNQWTLIADMNAQRSDASATEFNGFEYLVSLVFKLCSNFL
jgi:kelch-like protein 10